MSYDTAQEVVLAQRIAYLEAQVEALQKRTVGGTETELTPSGSGEDPGDGFSVLLVGETSHLLWTPDRQRAQQEQDRGE
jgi:hypothetical protein